VAFASTEVEIEVQRGVRQGDTLSPKLFVISLQYALDRINWAQRGLQIADRSLPYLADADDIVLLSHDIVELQTMSNDLCMACAEIGLKINVNKTKWLSTDTVQQQLYAHGKLVERVNSFI
jgi:hypothetical protein